MTPRRVGWVAMLALLAGFFFVGLADDRGPLTDEDRARRIAESVMCPKCSGQSVADSDAPSSRAIRTEINDLVAAGRSDDEIRAAIAGSYGEDVLMTPADSGWAGLVWVLPVMVIVAAVAGIGFAFLRWRDTAASRATTTDADRDLVQQALDELQTR